MSNPEQLYQKLHELCEALEADAEKAGVMVSEKKKNRLCLFTDLGTEYWH